jgi:hypothetical protein
VTSDPFNGPASEQTGDPFSKPASVGNFPKLEQLRGRLLLIRPIKLETGLLSSNSTPSNPQFYDRLTADVTVLEGIPAGFDKFEFREMFLSQSRLISQNKDALRTGGMVLGRLDTYKPGQTPGKGNPWGLSDFTPEDAVLARRYLSGELKYDAPTGVGFIPEGAAPNPFAQNNAA